MLCSGFLFSFLVEIDEHALIHNGHVTFSKDILAMTKEKEIHQ